MGRLTSACALLTAILVIVAALALTTVRAHAPLPAAGIDHATDHGAAQVVGLVAQLTSVESNVLPGGTIELVATIDNWTGTARHNLQVAVTVPEYPEALTWVEDSTLARLEDGGPVVELPPLGEEPTLLLATIESDQQVRIEWDMAVDECAQRDRLTVVALQVWTDELGRGATPLLVGATVYITPHKIALSGDLGVNFSSYPAVAAPGDSIRHIARLTNGAVMFPLRVRVRNLPDEAFFCVIHERGGACNALSVLAQPGPQDRWRGSAEASGITFTHGNLRPGDVLVLSWTGVVPTDAAAGDEITSRIAVDSSRIFIDRAWWSEMWTEFAAQVVIEGPHRQLSMALDNRDADRPSPTYWPGDHAALVVQVKNHSGGTVAEGLRLSLDLPTATSYIINSGSYSTREYSGGNARRLPDSWIDDGVALPTIKAGETIEARFELIVSPDAKPTEELQVVAVLQPDAASKIRESVNLEVAPRPELQMVVNQPVEVQPGDSVDYNVSVTNVGQLDLTGVRFGIEQTCDATYEPYSFSRLLQGGAIEIGTGESSEPDYRIDGLDVTEFLGELAAGETMDVIFTMHIADSPDVAKLKGPAFAVFTEESPIVGDRQEVELPIARQRAATAAELEAARDEILIEIRDVAQKTKATTDGTNELAEDIQKTGAETTELVIQTETLTNDIKTNTKAIEGQVDAILGQVSEVNPWGLGWKWVLLWGGFGALASLIAGFAVWFVLPSTLWHALVRLRERRQQGKNPYLAAPATPSAWKSPSQWPQATVRASGALVTTAADRVRDWVNGLRRR